MTMTKKRVRIKDALPDTAGPTWREEGKCDTDIDWFSDDKKDWRELQKVCNSGCVAKDDCLGYALETRQTYGVWGGCDPRRLREALGVNSHGEVHEYVWRLHCPRCSGLAIEHTPTNKTSEQCVCKGCGLEWTRLLVEPKRRRGCA